MIQRIAEEQKQVSGERKDKDVTDFPKAAAIGQALIDLEFPAENNKIFNTYNNNQKIIQIVKNGRYQSIWLNFSGFMSPEVMVICG